MGAAQSDVYDCLVIALDVKRGSLIGWWSYEVLCTAGRSEDDATSRCHTATQHTLAANRTWRHYCRLHRYHSTLERHPRFTEQQHRRLF